MNLAASPSTLIRLISLVVTLLIVAASSSLAQQPCDEDRACRYGGVCSNGMCACTFSCSRKDWGKELYCGEKNVKKMYMNLCELRSHACFLQRDIPIIPLKSRKDFKKVCRTGGSHPKPTERLCPDPEDFMGACMTSIDGSNNPSSGICLKKHKTKEKYCKCPISRNGINCESRVLGATDLDDKTAGRQGSPALIGLAVIFFLSLVVALSCILNKKCKKAVLPKNYVYTLEKIRMYKRGDSEQSQTLTYSDSTNNSSDDLKQQSPPPPPPLLKPPLTDARTSTNGNCRRSSSFTGTQMGKATAAAVANERTRLNSSN